MAQQVLKCRVSFQTLATLLDGPSFDLVWEATGANVNIDFTAAVTPTTVLNTFLNQLSGAQVQQVAQYLSGQLSRAANTVTVAYTDVTAHLDGSPAGPAFRTDFLTLNGAATTQSLPYEVAMTVGYRRDYGTDLEKGPAVQLPTSDKSQDEGAPATHLGTPRPRARDRGRIFVGPLCTGALGPTNGTPLAQAISDFGIAFDVLAQTKNNGLATQFNLVQWSRRNASVNPVRWYFVDENFTAQRRRSDPTANRVHSWNAVV